MPTPTNRTPDQTHTAIVVGALLFLAGCSRPEPTPIRTSRPARSPAPKVSRENARTITPPLATKKDTQRRETQAEYDALLGRLDRELGTR